MNIAPTQQKALSKFLQYFLGLVIGLIPLVPILVLNTLIQAGVSLGMMAVWGLFATPILYVIEIIVALITLAIKRVRFVGYGLLTMWLLILVVGIGLLISSILSPPPTFPCEGILTNSCVAP
jgi:hypothetical protein